MSSKKEKKKWSKRKKITVWVLSVILALIIIIVSGGMIALNQYCKTKEYQITSTDRSVTLIAHRGFRAFAPENTAAAFEAAGTAGFWGAECDVYRTADGVWVINHDVNTYRMMDKSSFIEKKTYDELMTYKIDNGSNIDKYDDLRLCTLEEYLQICKEYNMVAVIELKGKNNTEHYDEIIELVKKYEVRSVYISFHFENLKEIRKHTNSQTFYLVKEIAPKDIELAQSLENCGIDFDGNRKENIQSNMIERCINAGLDIGAWTINDPVVMRQLYDRGVKLITTDCIMYK